MWKLDEVIPFMAKQVLSTYKMQKTWEKWISIKNEQDIKNIIKHQRKNKNKEEKLKRKKVRDKEKHQSI